MEGCLSSLLGRMSLRLIPLPSAASALVGLTIFELKKLTQLSADMNATPFLLMSSPNRRYLLWGSEEVRLQELNSHTFAHKNLVAISVSSHNNKTNHFPSFCDFYVPNPLTLKLRRHFPPSFLHRIPFSFTMRIKNNVNTVITTL